MTNWNKEKHNLYQINTDCYRATQIIRQNSISWWCTSAIAVHRFFAGRTIWYYFRFVNKPRCCYVELFEDVFCAPPLKLLKLSGVLCCYAVGSEVMVNQWSPGRLMIAVVFFLHSWKTVSNQDNSMVLAIMQFSINQAGADGAFNPLPP